MPIFVLWSQTTYLAQAPLITNVNIRVFPKVDHFGNDARLVLEQNKFSKKKLHITGIEPSTL